MFDVHLGFFYAKAIDAEKRYEQLFFVHPPHLRDHINDAWKKMPTQNTKTRITMATKTTQSAGKMNKG
jgi:hypothetical protein